MHTLKRKLVSLYFALHLKATCLFRRSNRLGSESDWVELDRDLPKRYLRCVPDVTIAHLHKLIRMKFKENEETEVWKLSGNSSAEAERWLLLHDLIFLGVTLPWRRCFAFDIRAWRRR